MRLIRPAVLVVSLVALGGAGCRSNAPGAMTFTYDFSAGPQGWTAGFADYRPGEEGFLELLSDYRPLLPPLGPASALFISGNNHTDDLFMYFKREVLGLAANAQYRVTSDVRIATNVPRGCGGIGGSPGSSVYVKAGASTIEPRATVDAAGTLRMAIDIGNQATGGRDLVVLGTIENSRDCALSALVWEHKTLQSPAGASTVRATSSGSAWLAAGTDSAFEGTTSIYYTSITITLDPVR